jgi:hypothetical protein
MRIRLRFLCSPYGAESAVRLYEELTFFLFFVLFFGWLTLMLLTAEAVI